MAGEAGRITVATNLAGRGIDIRLSAKTRKLGGLHVIATERHSSRPVDRQHFGRLGRQGDLGSAQAFISVEDELLVRFSLETVRGTDIALLKARTPSSELAVSKAVAGAQKRAQALSYRQHRSVMQMDSWFDEVLSFTGAET